MRVFIPTRVNLCYSEYVLNIALSDYYFFSTVASSNGDEKFSTQKNSIKKYFNKQLRKFYIKVLRYIV